MILLPGWLFTLFAAFAELVGREATAAIRRKQAVDAAKAKAKKRADKVRERARKELERAREEFERHEKALLEKSREVERNVADRIEKLRVDVDDNPYPKSER